MVADRANEAQRIRRCAAPPEPSVNFMTRATRIGWAVLIGVAVGSLPAATCRADGEIFSKHAVVAQEGHAADVGRDVLRAGGNAVDAAVATAFALAVTLPEAGNLGGGGFLVAYLPDRREVVAVDFREMAPRSSSPTMYLGPDGKPRPRYRTGAWAAGVPGTVRGLAMAHARWGKRPWAEVVRPAVRLAREGFTISADLAGSLNRQLGRGGQDRAQGQGQARPRRPAGRTDFGRLGDYPETVAALGKPDGTPWREGDRLVQADLAATLERIANGGADGFYSGRTAELIARYMEEHGGFITRNDLASYEARIRPPVHTTFRGFDVYGVGPPSSGGVTVGLMLNILERYDLKADGRDAPRTLHRVTEAMRRAYLVRATRLADPDFVPVPVEELTSRSFADSLARSIGERATPSAELAPFPIQTAEGDHTTHLSTLDDAGGAVALTYTLEDSYGAKCVVAGAGFLLNNEMGDFNLIPGRTDTRGWIGTPANRIEPRKRMLSSQAPTLVLKDGRMRVVTGSPGGRTIPNTTLWVVLNLIEFGLHPRAAVDAPRTHHQWFPDALNIEGHEWPGATLEALTTLGHRVRPIEHQGNANTIVVEPAENGGSPRIHGVPDRRRPTTRASGD
jgi:gamma-glutamyltranspeptidase/glutathione hydrolase